MAPTTLSVLCLLQLVVLFCCCTAEEKTADIDNGDDLDTQETSWMITDPIQKKLQEIQFVKSKLLSPFSKAAAPSNSGGYPVYLTLGNGGFSGGTQYSAHATSYGPPNYWNKPVNVASQVWSNKDISGSKYQQVTSTYAVNCDPKTSSWKPSPVSSTYSAGTPLNYYYTSTGPTKTYGAPLVNFSTKSSIQTGISSLPEVASDSTVDSSPNPQSFGNLQTVNPSSYWPSSAWQIPSQSSSGSYVPSWSGVSGFYPSYSGLPQAPAAVPSSSLWSGGAGYYPASLSSSGQSPSQSTSTSSLQSPLVSSTSSPPFWSYFPQGSTPSPLPQQYYVASSRPTPAPLVAQSDEGEVRITPPPAAQLKDNFISTLPGLDVAAPVDASVYSSGSPYYGSYYPNVFYIYNEQHLEKPNDSGDPDQERSIVQVTSEADSPNKTLPSNDNTTVSINNQSTLGVLKSPLQPTNIVNQPKFPLVLSVLQPVPSSAGFYPSPAVPGAYSSSQTRTLSQPQILPVTRTATSLKAYSIPSGYQYQAPSLALQGGFQSQILTRTSPPC